MIPLENGRLGILVADVADKGVGAALYMALSRALIRTYAAEYHARPELALSAANRRVLMDTHTALFVTVFYGVLDPVSGKLTYCNVGHDPPYLLSAQDRNTVQALKATGVLLGMFKGVTWERRTVQLAPGDTLVLYTDGITEAKGGKGTLFGSERLLEIARANLGHLAQDVQEALIAEVHEFVGDAPQFDDITLIVIVRSATSDD